LPFHHREEPTLAEAGARADSVEPSRLNEGHRGWVRISHWVIALAFLTLAVTGILILMVHPRLYWGEAGNDLMPALIELPISANHQPDKLERTTTFTGIAGSPVSAYRKFEQFNENSWARSLHFLAGWFLVITGLFYVLAGLITGHVRRNLLPGARELAPAPLWQEVRKYLHFDIGLSGGGPPYGLMQKLAYSIVVFLALPLMLITGLTMAPAVTAGYPWLLDLFGGYQSARTVHFFAFAILLLFLFVHVALVVVTGFRRQLRAMLLGK
jgi:thiosulfate reductase cytochrome b subunit